jgi:hypothetical protein
MRSRAGKVGVDKGVSLSVRRDLHMYRLKGIDREVGGHHEPLQDLAKGNEACHLRLTISAFQRVGSVLSRY